MKQDIKEHVGWRVRLALAEDQLSHQDLATALGCSRRGLHRKLWGERDFALVELLKVAAFLERDLSWFLPARVS